MPTDIAMGIIICVRLCYPWDMIPHADFADFADAADIAMDNIIRVNLFYPWDMILPQIPQMPADIAMGIIICVNLCYPWDRNCSRRFHSENLSTMVIFRTTLCHSCCIFRKRVSLFYSISDFFILMGL